MMSGRVATGTILDRILDRTAQDVALRKARRPAVELQRLAAGRAAPVSLRDALVGPGISVIAEIKRASPSRGLFPVAVDPIAVAGEYLAGGAAAISVLTDEPFFQGSLADLEGAATVAHGRPKPAPVVRKDFIVDPYQIVEARAHGADAILLIVAALDDTALRALLGTANQFGLDALVEIHGHGELDRAIAAGATLIGINNRDLHTFAIDLAVTERLAPLVPTGTTIVAESGVFTAEDVARLEAVGADAVLVGEGLIVQTDRAAAVRSLLGRAEG